VRRKAVGIPALDSCFFDQSLLADLIYRCNSGPDTQNEIFFVLVPGHVEASRCLVLGISFHVARESNFNTLSCDFHGLNFIFCKKTVAYRRLPAVMSVEEVLGRTNLSSCKWLPITAITEIFMRRSLGLCIGCQWMQKS
jgi:hypothetical protein